MSLFKRRETRIASLAWRRGSGLASPFFIIVVALTLATCLYLLLQISSSLDSGYNTLSLSSLLDNVSYTINDADLKVSMIVPDACPVNMSISLFDLTYKSGFWDIPVQQPNDFYLNGGLPRVRRKHSRKSSSGAGSALGIRTETSLTFLRQVIANYSISTMIDLACGDANWIFDSWETDAIPLYLGLDVAASVIALNQERFRHHSNKLFRQWNGYECGVLPSHYLGSTSSQSRPFDLIHARDVIQHVKKENGVRMLCHIFASRASIFITTSYLNETENRELGSTEGRHFQAYNFDLPPFDFGPAEFCRMTHPDKHELDYTCVYDLRNAAWIQEFRKTKCQ